MPRKKKEQPKLFTCTLEENYDPAIVDRLKEAGITDINQVDPKCIDWYDIHRLTFKYPDCDYFMILGQRGNGKSYSTCKECLINYRDTQMRFVYMRRWSDDINTFMCQNLFKQELIEEVFGENAEIKYHNRTFQLVITEVDEDTGKSNVEKYDIGYATCISESHHKKGGNFPKVNLIFFDEFIDMGGQIALSNEYNKFENIINTIKRQNKVRVLMLCNTITKYSEFFTKMGINIDLVPQGSQQNYLHPNGRIKVALEYCRYNCLIGYFVGALTTSQMISTGSWEIPQVEDIPSEANEIVEEKLLCTAFLEDIHATIGIFLRHGTWKSYENNEFGLVQDIEHEREFLVIRRVNDDMRSSYFHLTNQKSLKNNYYGKLDLWLKDIEELTGIDIKNELTHLRVFCDNMFTGDIFNQIYTYYSMVKLRTLL